MAGAYVDIDTREVLSLSDKISGMKLSAKERRSLLKSIGVEVEEQTKERFATKIAPDGNRWKDIADSTKEWYRKANLHGQPPLVLKGGLRDSIESQIQDGAWNVLIGATAEWAAPHQYGMPKSKRKRGGDIPARPYLGLNTEDEYDISYIVDCFIAEKLNDNTA